MTTCLRSYNGVDSVDGSYATAEYYGVIRPSGVAEEQTIFAVEIHFQSAGYEETTVFNGFLYFLAGMSATNN